jgi:predicted Zn-dependent protease
LIRAIPNDLRALSLCLLNIVFQSSDQNLERYTERMAKLCPEHKLQAVEELFGTDPEEGLEEFADLLRTYPSDLNVRLGAAWAYSQNDEPELALPHLEFVLARHKGGEVYENLANVYAQLGMAHHAAQAARKAGERGKPRMLEALRDGEQAARFHEISFEPDQKDFLEYERALFDARFEREREAIAPLERFLKRHPQEFMAWLTLGVAQFAQGNFVAARTAFDAVLELDPTHPAALYERVKLEVFTNGVAEAQSWKARLAAANVSDSAFHGALIQAWGVLGDDEGVLEAVNAFRADANQAVDEATEDLVAHLESLAKQRLGLSDAVGVSDNALWDLQIGTEPYLDFQDWLPRSVQRRWNRLSGERLIAEMARDINAFAGWLSLVPTHIGFLDHDEARTLSAALVKRAPNDSSQLDTLLTVIQAGPGSLSGRLGVLAGLLDVNAVSTQVGIEIPGLAFRNAPIRIGYRVRFAQALSEKESEEYARGIQESKAERFDAARKRFLKLLERHPDDRSVQFNLINAEHHLGIGDELTSRLNALLERYPDYLHVRGQLALLAVEANDLEMARSVLRFPDDDDTFHVDEIVMYGAALARVWLERDDDLGEYMSLVNLLRQISPGNAVLAQVHSVFLGRLTQLISRSEEETNPSGGPLERISKVMSHSLKRLGNFFSKTPD